MPFLRYDYSKSPAMVAAVATMTSAINLVITGEDAIPAVSEALAWLKFEAGEGPSPDE